MKNKENFIDVHWVLEYQKGNKKALSFLVKKWHLRFCKLAFWIVKDAEVAKDVAQDSWTVIMETLYDLKEPAQFKNWAITIVKRRALDFVRTKNREYKKNAIFYNEAKNQLLLILKK